MFEDRYIYNVSPQILVLLMAVFMLTAVDFTLTRTGVARGLIQEDNPLLVWVMQCQIRCKQPI